MLNRAVLFSLCLGLCETACAQQGQASRISNDIPAITRKALPAVGLILVSDSTGKEVGQGSAFVVSPDGKVVTNYHVVQGASSAIIKFPNGAFFGIDGVLALDQDRDLALLKASGRDFPFLALGSLGSTQVGEQVIAIGNPLSLEATVSSGIVSAVREAKGGNLKIIQTTAPISPGSSGGVLLNLKGQVIGVTAFHLLKGENLNFAIAADYIRPLLASRTIMPLASMVWTPVEKTDKTASGGQAQETPYEPEGEEGYRTCGCESARSVMVFESAESADPIRYLTCGEEVTVFGKERGRLRIESSSGTKGYVSSLFVCKSQSIPTDLPRAWINTEDGSEWTIWAEGGHLYEQGDFYYDWKLQDHIREMHCICDLTGQGERWVGKCHYRATVYVYAAMSEYECRWGLGEEITSATSHRLEGRSQTAKAGWHPPGCPEPSADWKNWGATPKR